MTKYISAKNCVKNCENKVVKKNCLKNGDKKINFYIKNFRVQEHVLELLPMISEVNAVSEELNKYRHFELVLLGAATQEDNQTKVMIQAKDVSSGNLSLWERGKFMNRRYIIQEMYQQFLDDDDSWKDIKKEKVKPFLRKY